MPEFKKVKPARTPNQQITKLRERGLTIDVNDELEAINAIRSIGYFRLSGYFGPLQKPKDVFIPGTTFRDILRLYHFDVKLRRITSHALKTIEISIKTQLTDKMSAEYESDWYENEDIFMTEKKKKTIVSNYRCENGVIVEYKEQAEIGMYNLLKSSICSYIERNSESEFIKKFKAVYGSDAIVPSWMMMECISFGELSRLYSLIKPRVTVSRDVARYYGAYTSDNLVSWLYGFVIIRNACAHHSRIWNRMVPIELHVPRKKDLRFINDDRKHKCKFYGISACILRCLKEISNEEFEIFKSTFYDLVNEHGIQLSSMGFPETIESNDIWYREKNQEKESI